MTIKSLCNRPTIVKTNVVRLHIPHLTILLDKKYDYKTTLYSTMKT